MAVSKQGWRRAFEGFVDLLAYGPLALVGWFPLATAAVFIVVAIVWKSWAFVIFAAFIVAIRLWFRWLEEQARGGA